ncbi:PD-(D/E)XK nuclease-like domain-containing protein [Fimbriiglobus ruber]|uniref:Phage exonuclease n=1 Tax=Fimbriiglobus ruber TaxID=1908690 RepID=A0A225DL09_9BACT|nr:PD-(D/E)XK nuclease-like domain-containing protein [Fimbriiglobus ruber]OWK42170.1 Phage exonuclease [Fimbriiglobus ruber]
MTNKIRPVVEPGIYFNMPETAYHASEGLSCSGIKHLTVSKLNYWHKNLNPDREPEEDTGARRFGKATHAFALESERFAQHFAMKLSPEDFHGALVTADDMKAFLELNGLPKSAKKKSDLVDRIVASGLPAVIWDQELERHAAEHAGKTFLSKEESKNIAGAAAVMADDPYVKAALSGGMPEVSFFVRDPETGVMLKSRMDYVRPRSTVDIKTFSNSRGKPVEKAIFEAIFYEGYHLQCVFYNQVRELARQQLAAGEIRTHGDVSEQWLKEFIDTEGHGFVLIFIESSAPFHLRMELLKEAEAAGADLNVYWSSAHMRIHDMKKLYAECLEKYGDKPWRDPALPHQLEDTDLPMLMFS